MDQVKVYLALLKKYHFWPLAVLILLVGFFAWRSGKNNYDTQFEANKSALNSAFNAVSQVAGKQDHPNDFSIDEAKKLNTVQTKDVLAAWQRLYDNQKEVLTWPKEFEEIGRLKPTQPIRDNLRQIVFNYFHAQFPTLFSRVNLREEGVPGALPAVPAADAPAAPEGDGGGDGPAGGRAMGGANNNKPPIVGLVVWPQADRDKIVNMYRWPRAPGSKQIRYAQEDYWVYKALLDIISETNQGATSARNAAIKKIEALEIGQAVPRANDQAFPVPEGTVAFEEETKTTKSPSKTGLMTDEELDDGRYVSADGKPLASPGTESKEFKLMPIRMRFIMDQTRIPDLLVACANSPLPVEVQRWAYRPSEGRAPKQKSGNSMGGGGPARAAAPTQQAVNRGPIASDGLLELTPNDQIIEIRGLIYIFNPPDLGDLLEDAEGAEGGDAAAEGSAEAPVGDAPAEDTETEKPAADEQPAETTEPAAPAEGGEAGTETAPDAAAEPAAAEPAAGEPAAPAEPAATEEAPAGDAPAAAPMG